MLTNGTTKMAFFALPGANTVRSINISETNVLPAEVGAE